MGAKLDDSWERAYDEREKMKVLPKDYDKFLEFSKTAPENRRPQNNWRYGNPREYDHYGMWETLGKPADWKTGLKNNPDYRPNPEDKLYHGYSTNPKTGIFLKSHIPYEFDPNSTAYMEFNEFKNSKDPNWNTKNFSLDYDPKIQRMRYKERPMPRFVDGGFIDEDPIRRDVTDIINPEKERVEKLAQMNTNSHSFRMEHDPDYANIWKSRAKETSARYGGIDYVDSDIRSKSYTGNPNSIFSTGQTGEVAAGTENFNNALISSFLPLPGTVAPSNIRTSSQLYKNIKGGPTRFLNKDELSLLRNELKEKGVLDIQNTRSMGGLRESTRGNINPYGYDDIANRLKTVYQDTKQNILSGGKNPNYIKDKAIRDAKIDEEIAFKKSFHPEIEINRDLAEIEYSTPTYKELWNKKRDLREMDTWIDHSDYDMPDARNRFDTFNMYLGYPQYRPFYKISELSTNKNPVYTFNKKYLLNGLLDNVYPEVAHLNPGESKVVSNLTDDFAGTMGQYSANVERLKNGNFKIVAEDIWDLHPLRKPENAARLSKKLVKYKQVPTEFGSLEYPIHRKLTKKIAENFEPGELSGIGKPIDVKFGIIYNPKTQKIVKTFGVAPVAAGALPEAKNKEQQESEYEDTWY